MSSKTHTLMLRLLRWFCKPEYLEEIEGDINELYQLRSKSSKRKANILLTKDVILSLRPSNLKGISLEPNFPILVSYFTTGYRNLKKDIGYTLINLMGMSVALCLFILMILVVAHERSFDQFHSKSERIYQVIQVFQNADGDDPEIFTAMPLAQALEAELGVVEKAVTVHGAASTWIEVDGKKYFEEDGIVAGENFLRIFDFPFEKGTENALDADYSIVITESLAQKYFNSTDCLGKVVHLERYGLFTVSAVLEDIPSNSTMQFNYIITQNYETYFTKVANWFPPWFKSWQGSPAATFVLLNSSEDKNTLESNLKQVVASHLAEEEEANDFYLLSLNNLHYGLNGVDGRINEYRKGDKVKSRMLILVATIVLVMGCFNYLNIATARLARRSREVGLRKAIGAYRSQISWQFLIESFVLIGLGMVLAIIMTYYSIPLMTKLSGIPIELSLGLVYRSVPFLLGVVIIISFIVGAYPAIYLNNLATTEALNATGYSTGNSSILRNVLLTLQFGLALVMVLSLVIISQQYHFMRGKNLGFNTDQLAVVEVNGTGVRSNYHLIKQELLGDPAIKSVTGLTRMISGYRTGPRIELAEPEVSEIPVSTSFYGMDQDGPKVLGFNFIAGSDFSGEIQEDSSSIILNRTAAQLFGGLSVVGRELRLSRDNDDELLATVIGVVEDFHTQSLHEAIGPVVIGYLDNQFQGLDDIVIKVDGENALRAIEKIEEVHDRYDENGVITLEFLDDMIERSYKAESDFRNVLLAASLLGIIIAVLGTIGLTAYLSETRSKEIGIRKILGASLGSILILQSRLFFTLIILAIAVVSPITWIIAGKWLSQYAYRIELKPTVFLVTAAGFIFLTGLTILTISFRSISRNPVDSLRTE